MKIQLDDYVDYGGIICQVKVINGDKIVAKTEKSLYKFREEECSFFKRIDYNKNVCFCFVCGTELREYGLGIMKCKDDKCDSMFLPFLDKEGNQNLILGKTEENNIQYDLPKTIKL